MTTSRSFMLDVPADGASFEIALPFDPREVFGSLRAPVVVTINGHRYRSTITNMGGSPWIPFRKSNRDAAKLPLGKSVEVVVALDEEQRTVGLPDDLAEALDAVTGARAAWEAMSFTMQREHAEAIEEAKKPETRTRRIEKALAFVRGRIKD